jgi:hypothetical protein
MVTRRQYEGEATAQEIVDFALRGTNDINVVIGPLLWQPSDGTGNKIWYFTITTSEARRGASEPTSISNLR